MKGKIEGVSLNIQNELLEEYQITQQTYQKRS